MLKIKAKNKNSWGQKLLLQSLFKYGYFFKKSNKWSFPPLSGKGSSWQLTIDFLVGGEINFISEFCILQESFENVIPFDGEKGQIILIFCIFDFIKMKYPQGWKRVVFIIFWISGILHNIRAHLFKLLWKCEATSILAVWQSLVFRPRGFISLPQCSVGCTQGQGRIPASTGARRQEAGFLVITPHLGFSPLLKENECKGLISFICSSNTHNPQQDEFYQPCLVVNASVIS